MEKETKQDAFLKIMGRMIGAIHFDAAAYDKNGMVASEYFNSLIDSAIAKAHQVMEESKKYEIEVTHVISGEELLEQAKKQFEAGNNYRRRKRNAPETFDNPPF